MVMGSSALIARREGARWRVEHHGSDANAVTTWLFREALPNGDLPERLRALGTVPDANAIFRRAPFEFVRSADGSWERVAADLINAPVPHAPFSCPGASPVRGSQFDGWMGASDAFACCPGRIALWRAPLAMNAPVPAPEWVTHPAGMSQDSCPTPYWTGGAVFLVTDDVFGPAAEETPEWRALTGQASTHRRIYRQRNGEWEQAIIRTEWVWGIVALEGTDTLIIGNRGVFRVVDLDGGGRGARRRAASGETRDSRSE